MFNGIDMHLYNTSTIGTNTETDVDKTNTHIDTIEVEVNSLLLMESLSKICKYIKPKQSYHYIYLDSNNAIFSPDRSTMQWLINDGDPVYRPHYCNLTRQLRNIVAMRLGRITWTNMNIENSMILNGDPNPGQFIANVYQLQHHIGIGFREFVSQSIICPSGPRIHFVQYNYNESRSGSYITTSGFFENRGWFRFRKPFTKLDTLTMSVYDLSTCNLMILPDTYVTINTIQYFQVPDIKGIYYNIIKDPPSLLRTIGLMQIPFVYAYTFGSPNYTAPLYSFNAEYKYDNFTTNNPVADAALIARYNSIHKAIPGPITVPYITNPPTLLSPIDISSASLNIGQGVPITITFLFKPNMVAALELITEDID